MFKAKHCFCSFFFTSVHATRRRTLDPAIGSDQIKVTTESVGIWLSSPPLQSLALQLFFTSVTGSCEKKCPEQHLVKMLRWLIESVCGGVHTDLVDVCIYVFVKNSTR